MLQFTPKVKSADSCLMATHYINFTKTIYNLLCNQANRQTDKQTNKQTKATRKALTGGHTDDFITCYGFHFRSAFQLSVPPSHPVMCMHSQRYFSSWELPLKLKVWPITFNIELGPESIKAKHHNKYLCMSKVTSLESCHRDRQIQPGGGEHVHAGLTRSVGAKHPTHSERRIHPRAWLLLFGFWDSCLQIWQYISSLHPT